MDNIDNNSLDDLTNDDSFMNNEDLSTNHEDLSIEDTHELSQNEDNYLSEEENMISTQEIDTLESESNYFTEQDNTLRNEEYNFSEVENRHIVAKSSYSLDYYNSPQITLEDNELYQHNFDGSKNLVGSIIKNENNGIILILDSIGNCVGNIDSEGNIHRGFYHSGAYLGRFKDNNVYDGQGKVVAHTDTPEEAAAHLCLNNISF